MSYERVTNFYGRLPGPTIYEVAIEGLSLETKEDDARKYFAQCGKLHRFRMNRDERGKSRGSAFAGWTTSQSAADAVLFDGKEFQGSTLSVRMLADYDKEKGKDKGKGKSKGMDTPTPSPLPAIFAQDTPAQNYSPLLALFAQAQAQNNVLVQAQAQNNSLLLAQNESLVQAQAQNNSLAKEQAALALDHAMQGNDTNALRVAIKAAEGKFNAGSIAAANMRLMMLEKDGTEQRRRPAGNELQDSNAEEDGQQWKKPRGEFLS